MADLFGAHAFRRSLAQNDPNARRTPLNVSLFETCTVTMFDLPADLSKVDRRQLKNGLTELLEDEDFYRSITYSTNSSIPVPEEALSESHGAPCWQGDVALMISSLQIENFKCFKALRLELGPLTLLTGYNGGGKSSFVHPLLLLSQGLNGRGESSLALNGPLIRLGTVADVAGAGDPSFEVTSGADCVKWQFSSRAGERVLGIRSAEAVIPAGEGSAKLTWTKSLCPDSVDHEQTDVRRSSVLASLRSLVAISATRLGALDVQPMPDAASPVRGDVGGEGQFASFWVRPSSR